MADSKQTQPILRLLDLWERWRQFVSSKWPPRPSIVFSLAMLVFAVAYAMVWQNHQLTVIQSELHMAEVLQDLDKRMPESGRWSHVPLE
jgi:hypothetical protein